MTARTTGKSRGNRGYGFGAATCLFSGAVAAMIAPGCAGAGGAGNQESAEAVASAGEALVQTPGGRQLRFPGGAEQLLASPSAPYLVAKFDGARTKEDRALLAAAGYTWISPLPGHAALVRRAPDAKPAKVVGWAPFLAEDRVSRELAAGPAAIPQASRAAGRVPAMVHVMPGADVAAMAARLRASGLEVVSSGHAGEWGRIVTFLPAETMAERATALASVDDVFFVERIHRMGYFNDKTVGSVQSGVQGFAPEQTPIWQKGIHGEGQIVGIIDTGIDADSCYFGDEAHGLPKTNTFAEPGGYGTEIDPTHRKVVAYDFLYSCDQYPSGDGCETPSNPAQWDTQGHGSHCSGTMVGDSDNDPLTHATDDGVAPAAKIVVQDAAYKVDPCGDIPGLGCPLIDTFPVFEQSYKQGARIHNNSYGDNEDAVAPGQANYSARSQDVDRFIWQYRDFLIIHAAGNSGAGSVDFSVGSPSNNKNGLSIGSTRVNVASTSDEDISSFSSRGWSGDGRVKPDLMAPGCTASAGNDKRVDARTCTTNSGCGTSYAAPSTVGAATLARQYFVDGFYPSGQKSDKDSLTPTAALLKATLINSAMSMTGGDNSKGPISPIPSNEQGWGRIQLDRSLIFAGATRKLLVDDHRDGFAAGSSGQVTYTLKAVGAGEPLKVTLVWTDFPGTPDSPPASPTIDDASSWSSPQLVNDLDLTVAGPDGTFLGNVLTAGVSTTGGTADRRNNVEEVLLAAPAAGDYTITVTANHVAEGPQDFALVATGTWSLVPTTDGGGEPPSGTVPDGGDTGNGGASSSSGCGCRVAPARSPAAGAFALIGLGLAMARRRRK